MPVQRSKSEGVANLLSGFFQEWMANRQHNQTVNERQAGIVQEHDYQTQQIQGQRDFSVSQQEQERLQRINESNAAYRKNVLSAAAESGGLTDEMLKSIENDLDPATLSALKSLSEQQKKDKEAAAAFKTRQLDIEAGKTRGVGHTSSAEALNYVQDALGQGFSPEVYREAAAVYEVGGEGALGRWIRGAGDLPRESGSALDALTNQSKALKALESTQPDLLKQATARGVPHSLVAQYATSEKPDDALRHATADTWTQAISSGLGIDPKQPISMEAVNNVIRTKYPQYHAIQGDPQRELSDLVDEMVGLHIGVNPKTSALEVIMQIITDALTPQQPETPNAPLTGISRVFSNIGMKTASPFMPRQSMSGIIPTRRNPNVQGNRRP